jgi:succinate dehydrogenase hydrophobic anchor subunit
MEFLLKSSGIILILYTFYMVFLRRETFFQHNRMFFLFGYAAALTLPLILITRYVHADTGFNPITAIVLSEADGISATRDLNLQQLLWIGYFGGVIFLTIRFLISAYTLFSFSQKADRVKKGKYIFIATDKNISPFSFFNLIVYNPALFNDS